MYEKVHWSAVGLARIDHGRRKPAVIKKKKKKKSSLVLIKIVKNIYEWYFCILFLLDLDKIVISILIIQLAPDGNLFVCMAFN